MSFFFFFFNDIFFDPLFGLQPQLTLDGRPGDIFKTFYARLVVFSFECFYLTVPFVSSRKIVSEANAESSPINNIFILFYCTLVGADHFIYTNSNI